MTQVEAHGAAKLRQCACASPVALVNTLPDDVLNHVEVLHRNEPPSAKPPCTFIHQVIRVKCPLRCAAVSAGVQVMLYTLSSSIQQGSHPYLVLLVLRCQASRHLWRSVAGAAR